MKKLLWMGCLAYMLIGLAHVVVGSLLTVMLDYYGRDYSDGGQLIFAQFAGFLIGVLSTPWWSQKLSKRGTLLLAFGSLGAAELLFSFLPPWYIMLAAAPFAGFGFGIIEAAIGALVIEAIEEKKAIAMSRLEVFFGVGALIMPLLASAFILAGWWQATFVTLALFSLAMAAGFGRMSFGTADAHLRGQSSAAGEKLQRAAYEGKQKFVLALFAGIFLLYVGIEMSLANFLPAIFIENFNVNDATGALSVTFFWGTMAVGRVFAGVIAEKVTYSRYILVSSLGTLVVLVAFLLVMNVWGAFLLVLLLGLVMSGLFAILLIYANYLMPGKTERTTSFLIASGGIGGALVPLFTGWSLDQFSVNGTLWVLAGCTLLMLAFVVVASKQKVTEKDSHKAAVNYN